MLLIPDVFARTIVDLHGEAGEVWLAGLPGLLADCAMRWGLMLAPPFAPLTYNYVAPAVRADGTRVVLKVGFPGRTRTSEIEALRLYQGRGAARLLAADTRRGAMLIERLEPGITLAALVTETEDERATAAAAEVMRLIRRPAPPGHGFPSVADWGAGFARMRRQFAGGSGPLPAALAAEAETLFTDLLASSAAPVLLHGDLHHDNILAAGRRPWLAIDPQGVLGEPAYEVGALLRNPLPQLLALPQPGRILARRVDQLAEALGLDRARVRGWGLAQAVLSAWWSIEDHGEGWEPTIACAELLAAV